MNNSEQSRQEAQALREELGRFVGPLLVMLDEQLDKRLVGTFLKALEAIISFRHSSYGLLLSELGGYILSPDRAPAGTKRLSNLLRSPKWTADLISRYLWQRAGQRMEELELTGEEALLVWDESVLEKAESQALEGLCAVRSSVAARLKRIKPGFYNPPGGRPVFVPGLNWLSVMLLGMSGHGVVVAMEWWTTRGLLARDKRSVEHALLTRLANAFGAAVLHVWDRGFAGEPWLLAAFDLHVRFVMRWPKRLKLLNAQGELLNAWKIARGKRSWQHRYLWDARRRQRRKVGFLALEVAHPASPHVPLWLVISRQGAGRQPWYLLTNDPIFTDEQAWHLILAYARRWQIEMAFRFSKTDLALESPRLWRWDNRLKLLMMVSLVYAFLLSLLDSPSLLWLMRAWCHRTGKRGQLALTPLYRLRAALSRLWLAFPPPRFYNSG